MSINILNFKALVGAFNKDKALVGKLRNFAKVLCQLYAAYICIVCCVVWPVSAPAGFCEDYIWVTMSGHCECARAAGNTMQRVHTVQGSCCFICRYWHGAQCGSGTLRGQRPCHTVTSAFSSQYLIRLPPNSYFLIVDKKYRTAPPVSQSRAHIYANPPFSNFHHQLGPIQQSITLGWLGWAGLGWSP